MSGRLKLLLAALAIILAANIGVYTHAPGTRAYPGGVASAHWQEGEPFRRVQREGSVDLRAEYDLDNLAIPEEEIHTLLPRDAIPALTDPPTDRADASGWLRPESRIIVAEVTAENGVARYGVPLQVLDRHEIVNTTLSGAPIAITYCPLCDSATVFSRTVEHDGGERAEGEPPRTTVLEFGVSGALYNSNVLMYDTLYKGLWSQLAMTAVSGPMAGAELDMLPVRILPYERVLAQHPGMPIVNQDTGHERDYTLPAYQGYFSSDRLLVPVRQYDDALARKTLGAGIVAGDEAWFVAEAAIPAEGYTLETPMGAVAIQRSEAGIDFANAPEGVKTAQAFFYSWTAFFPDTVVIGE
ncbi:MAG: DUF3179 domain-containing (seleno)protein [Planctomycetota bacterium]